MQSGRISCLRCFDISCQSEELGPIRSPFLPIESSDRWKREKLLEDVAKTEILRMKHRCGEEILHTETRLQGGETAFNALLTLANAKDVSLFSEEERQTLHEQQGLMVALN